MSTAPVPPNLDDVLRPARLQWLRSAGQEPHVVRIVWRIGGARRTKDFSVRRHARADDVEVVAGARDAALAWARGQGLTVLEGAGIRKDGRPLGHAKLNNELGVAGVFCVWVAWRHSPSLVVKGIWPDPLRTGRYVQVQRSVLAHGLEAALRQVVEARLAAHPELQSTVDVADAIEALRRVWDRGPPEPMRSRCAAMGEG
jgi:hypothetical protein